MDYDSQKLDYYGILQYLANILQVFQMYFVELTVLYFYWYFNWICSYISSSNGLARKKSEKPLPKQW